MDLLGKFLIAPPAVKGNFWHKTVIMITEHHGTGSIGLVLNKPSNLTLQDFGRQLNLTIDIPGKLYIGGPVNNQSLSMLHSNDWVSKNTIQINDKFSLSSAEDMMPRLSLGDCPQRWRLFMGLCGWANGQLLGEIKGSSPWKHENSWCLAKPNLDLAFNSDGNEQWCAALDKSASDFAQSMLA
jgi:putative transcriptional regulator